MTATGFVVRSDSKQRERLEIKYASLMKEDFSLSSSVSYVGNKSVPILRLFRYKEAFSLKFVHRFLDLLEATEHDVVFDPFAGMGTTLFAAMQRNTPSIGVERLPIATFIAKTLPKFLTLEPGLLSENFNKLKVLVSNSRPAEIANDVPINGPCF